MPDYTDQFNQERKENKRPKIKKKTKNKSPEQTNKIESGEWGLIFAIAIIGDIIFPIGILCGGIILLWYIVKSRKLPIGRLIGFVLAETATLGIFPGLFGFVLMDYLKYKGYTGKWLTKLKAT